MRSYFIKTPQLFIRIFPERIWGFSKATNKVYLTFDDGPIPQITPWVLEILKKYNSLATFFCVGNNIKKHPKIVEQIYAEGHSIGNHTFNHLKGWKTPVNEYIEDVEDFEYLLHSKFKIKSNKLFRPPYGKIKSSQANILLQRGYRIIMWNVLSADFDSTISKQECYENVLAHITPGSIIVFHDSLKAKENLIYTLPKILKYIQEKKWQCVPIT